MVSLSIMEILRKYTDYDHRLSVRELTAKLREEYGLECSERSMRRYINELRQSNPEIVRDRSGVYLSSREFDDSELRLLIDSIISSKHIPSYQAKELIEKLSLLSNVYFNNGLSDVQVLDRTHNGDNRQIFYTIDMLSEAITKGRMVEFTYNTHDSSKKMVPRRSEPYRVSPYKLAAANGNYSLICSYDKYESISHFRVDRITDVAILEEEAKPLEEATNGKGLDLPKHMAEHLYMFSGDPVLAQLSVDKAVMSALIDWFGKDFEVYNEIADRVFIKVRVNPDALACWAMQYGDFVEILSPRKLRRKMAAKSRLLMEKYWQDPL